MIMLLPHHSLTVCYAIRSANKAVVRSWSCTPCLSQTSALLAPVKKALRIRIQGRDGCLPRRMRTTAIGGCGKAHVEVSCRLTRRRLTDRHRSEVAARLQPRVAARWGGMWTAMQVTTLPSLA